jgi:hypothetical protein
MDITEIRLLEKKVEKVVAIRGMIKAISISEKRGTQKVNVPEAELKADFGIVEGFVEYDFEYASMPVSIFGNVIQNTVASTSEDEGWLIGFKLNKCKAPGSWDFRWNYRDLEADAVLGAFSDSDFIGGGTDGKGHELGLNYQLTKNVQAGLTYFVNERDRGSGSDDDYRRLQADLQFKF